MRVALLDVLGEHEHADVRAAPRGSRARRAVPRRCGSGGMRMSMTATSGLCARDLAQQVLGVAGLAHDLDAGLLEQPHDALAQQHRVLGDDYARTGSPPGRSCHRPARARRPRAARRAPRRGRRGRAGPSRRPGRPRRRRRRAPRRSRARCRGSTRTSAALAVRVLGDVRQRLGHDEVGRRLDRRGQPLAPASRPVDGHGRPAGQRLERRAAGRGR